MLCIDGYAEVEPCMGSIDQNVYLALHSRKPASNLRVRFYVSVGKLRLEVLNYLPFVLLPVHRLLL